LIGMVLKMRSNALLSLSVSVIGLLLAGDARAQDTGGTPNYPPPGSGTPNFPPPNPPPNAPPPNAPPPAVAPGTAPLPAPAPGRYREGEEQEPGDEGRLRIGFNVDGGLGTGGNFKGPAIGATFRIGWQLDKLMAIYGQVGVVLWVATSSETLAGKSFDASAIGGYRFTPMFSLTPVDLFEVAAGPSLDNLSGGSSSTSIAGTTLTQEVKAYTGYYFGIHARAALHIGGKPNMKTGRRVSFTIGFDVHPTFAEGSTIMFYTLGLGGDWY
jgi:hypothetical protein